MSFYSVQNPDNFVIHPTNPPFIYPAGVISPYAGTAAPEGFLLCNGNAVSRSTYAALFNIIGTSYGSGNGTTTFNVPNMIGRVPVGCQPESGYFNALGDQGGVTDVTLSVGQMPSHNHNGTTDSAGTHTHTSNAVGGQGNLGLCIADGTNTATVTDPNAGQLNLWTTPRTLTINADGSHVHTFISNNTGNNESHTNVQPYIVVNYIIKY